MEGVKLFSHVLHTIIPAYVASKMLMTLGINETNSISSRDGTRSSLGLVFGPEIWYTRRWSIETCAIQRNSTDSFLMDGSSIAIKLTKTQKWKRILVPLDPKTKFTTIPRTKFDARIGLERGRRLVVGCVIITSWMICNSGSGSLCVQRVKMPHTEYSWGYSHAGFRLCKKRTPSLRLVYVFPGNTFACPTN